MLDFEQQTWDEWVALSADVATILLVVGTAVAAVRILRGALPLVASTLRRQRKSSLDPVRALGVGTPHARRIFKYENRQLVLDRLRGRRGWSAEVEMAWLDRVVNSGAESAIPLSYSRTSVSEDPSRPGVSSLGPLAQRYTNLANRLDSRALISSGNVPVIATEARLARTVAASLSDYNGFRPVMGSQDAWVTIVNERGRRVDLAGQPTDAPSMWPELVVTSRRALRTVPEGFAPAETAADRDGVACRRVPLPEGAANQLEQALSGQPSAAHGPRFDGLLPRLAAWRLEREDDSPRSRLHLLLEECTYSSVLTQYGGTDGVGAEMPDNPFDASRNVGLLSESLLVVTSDRKLLIPKRPGTLPPMGGLWVPTVNGNLEMRPRPGIRHDVDEFGRLDPIRAITREAREELGIELDTSQVRCLGLGRFAFDGREWGTHVLAFLTTVTWPANELQHQLLRADPIEGSWEIGDEWLLLPWEEVKQDIQSYVSWALCDEAVSPHLAISLALVERKLRPDTHRPQPCLPSTYRGIPSTGQLLADRFRPLD